jgi:hypothetical protein
MIPVKMSFVEIFNAIENAGRKRYKQETGNIRQLLVRNISIPKNASQSGREIQWIKDHTSFDRYLSLAQEFERIMIKDGKKPLMILPFDGSRVWGYRGISVVFSDYCIQESTREDAVRSLIYQADGHLYSSWSDPASILF